MALAFSLHPRVAALLPFPSSPPRIRRRLVAAAGAAARQGESVGGGGAAVVWFKNDLRVDDHPGLVAAVAQHPTVVPLYVFDPRILADYSDVMLELLLFALRDLKNLLKSQGSDLFIGLGNTEDIVFKIVNEVRASHIFTEEEVEYTLRRVVTNVESSLSVASFSWGCPDIVVWRSSLYDFENLKELPSSYNHFLNRKLSKNAPLDAPTMPLLKLELDRGTLPAFDEVKKFLNEQNHHLDESWVSLKNVAAKVVLRKENISQETKSSGRKGEETTFTLTSYTKQRAKLLKSFFASQSTFEVRGGTDMVLDALAAYLRYLEGTGKDDWQELHEKVRQAESRNLTSFNALFGSSLLLGVISRRRVHYEAIKYERERNAGFLSPFGYSTPTVTLAVDVACSMEWYWLLGLKSQICSEDIYPVRIWRWKGYLIQYTAVGHDGPALLFVHGFGGFLEHFRDNVAGVANVGHRVWALTLLGFGKSEKPSVRYTELLWAELLRDFIIDVVAEPVHLVGNSLGGYVVALLAGLWPSLGRSMVLINTAGSVVPNFSSLPLSEETQTSWLAQLQARLLLLYLRSRAGNLLKNYYPTNNQRVDNFLTSEIIRASYDPGAVTVLESVFNFNLLIPLNYLFDSFGGEVLVLQGMRDPLLKPELFLSVLREQCRKVTIREVNAGHCPHDELPEEVNSLLSEWTCKFS